MILKDLTKKKKKIEKTEEQIEKELELKIERKNHEESVISATKKNLKAKKKGVVICDRLPGRFEGKTWPKVEGFKNINVTSGARGVWKDVSPMKLGPVLDDKGVFRAENVENCWQFSKVYEGDVDGKGVIKDEFFERRDKGWKDIKGHRRSKKGRVLFSYWEDEKMDYFTSRKRIYCPIYAELVVNTNGYKEMKKLIDGGTNIQILGYDGYSTDDLDSAFLDLSKPFGHELVLLALLTDQKPWETINTTPEDSDTQPIIISKEEKINNLPSKQ